MAEKISDMVELAAGAIQGVDFMEVLDTTATDNLKYAFASLLIDLEAGGALALTALESLSITHQVDEASAKVLDLIGPNRAVPTDDDEIFIPFTLEGSVANQEFARISAVALDVTDATEDGAITVDVMVAGSLVEALKIVSDLIDHTQLILPQFNDEGTPSFAFGTGVDGIYSSAAGIINVAIAGLDTWNFNALSFGGSGAGRPAIANVNSSDTVPGLLPTGGDSNTGWGQRVLDEMSGITGGVERSRVSADGLSSIGFREIWIDAAAMLPLATAGAESATEEYATNDINSDHFLFDGAAEEHVQFRIVMPDTWDLGTVKVKVFWDAAVGASAADGVTWGISGGAVSNDDPIDAALGTEVDIDDTVIAVGDLHVSPATASITIGGTPALADAIWLQIARKVADVNDDMVEDAKLLGIQLQYKTLISASVEW